MLNQANDGVTFMDGDLYKTIYEGNLNILMEKYSEAHFHLQRTPKKNNILHLAAQFGRLECVSWILDAPSSSSLLKKTNLRGETPLQLAAREGHLEVVKALIVAAKKSLHQEIESGIGDKAMLRMANKEGDTALHEAVRYHHSEVVKTLIEEDPEFVYGSNINDYTPLYMAAERGYGDLVDIIIDKTRTSPAHTGIMGRTALHAAVIGRNKEMTAKLLEWKPDLIKQVDKNGWSPLHCAASLGYDSIVKQLLVKSSDKSVIYLGIKEDKKTALHLAASRGNMETVKVILSYCPDCCEQVDDKGKNVLHLAMMADGKEIASHILKEKGWLRVRGVVNEKDDQGDTPLHVLASGKCYPDLPFFEDNTVDKMALNNDNRTPVNVLLSSKIELRPGFAPYRRWMKIRRIIRLLTRKEPMESDDGSSSEEETKEAISRAKKAAVETHLIAAALIATVTFAAGFTLPGGYKQDDGMAMLSRKAAFKAFIVTDTIAVMLSLSAVFVYFFMSVHTKGVLVIGKHFIFGFWFTTGAMIAMMAAFVTGLYAVLPLSGGLPIVASGVCGCFLFALYFGFKHVYFP